MKHVCLAGCFFVVLSGLASAQTPVTNPNLARFTPSLDHDTTEFGQPKVTRYDLLFYRQGAVEPEQTVDIGKPALEAGSGDVVVDLMAIARPIAWAGGQLYVLHMRAVGAGGMSAHAVGDRPFDFRPTVPGAPSAVRIGS